MNADRDNQRSAILAIIAIVLLALALLQACVRGADAGSGAGACYGASRSATVTALVETGVKGWRTVTVETSDGAYSLLTTRYWRTGASVKLSGLVCDGWFSPSRVR